MIELGDWDTGVKARLTELRDEMQPFAKNMKTPRNKLTVHNDVATVMSATEHGKFDAGEDVEYFGHLKEFAEIVVNMVLDEHFDYDNAVPTDVDLFVDAFNRGRIGGECAA
jgi:hypothetical protein